MKYKGLAMTLQEPCSLLSPAERKFGPFITAVCSLLSVIPWLR